MLKRTANVNMTFVPYPGVDTCGDIKGRQVCPGAPWVIKTADLIGFTGRKRSDPTTPLP
jgi:hypothetical protein